MKNLMMATLVLLVAACSSTPTAKLGEDLDSSRTKVRVTLGSKANLFVSQKLRSGIKCEDVKNKLIVSAKPEAEPMPLTFQTSCNHLKGYVTTITKELAPKGSYLMEIRREGLGRNYTGNPVVSAKYVDPDFNSTADFTVEGAKELEAGQNVKGSLSHSLGNPSDWIRIKGKNAAVTLLLMENDTKGDGGLVQAQVYDFPVGSRYPRPLGSLSHKSKRTFSLKNDNLVVRVGSKERLREVDYTLIRGDVAGAGGRTLNVPVIDCYRVSDSSSVVLLKKVDGLKMNDDVTVYGTKSNGEKVNLGQCQVTSIEGDQASCRLDSAVGGNFVEYKAEAREKQG